MTNAEYLKIINDEPTGVKESEDKSYRFIPISIVEGKMDEIYGGDWSFTMDRELFGKGFATGVGTLSYVHPVSGNIVGKTGTAAVALTKDINMDFPRLESACILNAAKKIGVTFGRNLNRDKDDAEVKVIQVEKENMEDAELSEQILKISAMEYRDDAEAYIQSSHWKHHIFLKNLISKKPKKPE